MRIRSAMTCASIALLLVLVGCDEDANTNDPREDCQRTERGVVLGEHVHGTPEICSGLQYLLNGEVEFVTVPAGEAGHTHSIMVDGKDVQRLFGGEALSKQTVAAGVSHQNWVTFTP